MVEFFSPHSLQVCVQRVQALEKGKGRFPLSARAVKVRCIDENSYEFRLERWVFFNLVAKVQGTLVFDGNQLTRTSLTESLSPYLRFLLFIYGVGCAVLIAFGAIKGNTVTVFGGLAALIWGFIVWLVWSQFPKRLTKSVTEILS